MSPKHNRSSTLLERVPEVNFGHLVDFVVGGFRRVLYPPHAFLSLIRELGLSSYAVFACSDSLLGGGSGIERGHAEHHWCGYPIHGFRSFVSSKGFNLRKVRLMTPSCFSPDSMGSEAYLVSVMPDSEDWRISSHCALSLWMSCHRFAAPMFKELSQYVRVVIFGSCCVDVEFDK